MESLPAHMNGNIQWLYNGAELPPLSDEDAKLVMDVADPLLLLRREFQSKIKVEIFDSYSVFKHNFQILKEVSSKIPTIPISNISLMLLFEDSCKVLSVALSDMTDKIIALLKLIPSKYMGLFKSTALKKLIADFSTSDPAKAPLYTDVLTRHEEISKKLFKYGMNAQGQPLSKNFELIKDDLFARKKNINEYRDNVAAHVNHEQKTYQPKWIELEEFMAYFETLVSDMYFLAVYGNANLSIKLAGQGLKQEQTVMWFCKGLSL